MDDLISTKIKTARQLFNESYNPIHNHSSTITKQTPIQDCNDCSDILFLKVDYQQFQTNLRACTFNHNVITVSGLPCHLSSAFLEGIRSQNILWQQSFNDFYGGGFVLPKLYSAFSRDMINIPFYVPHWSARKPLVVYKAQPWSDFPLLLAYESLLRTLGYTDFNFVTVLMYPGAGSHINAHTDEEQIEGFHDGTEVIATFTYGAERDLKIKFDEGKQTRTIKNANNSLYVMEGIQRFTTHEKPEGHGISFSVIFRKLSPPKYRLANTDKFNINVEVDWNNGTVPRAWLARAQFDDSPGTCYSLADFNSRRLHSSQQCSVMVKDGIAISIVLYSDKNIVNDTETKVWFVGYDDEDRRTKSKNAAILRCSKASKAIHIFKKLPGQRKYLGQFIVDEAVVVDRIMYFSLIIIK